MRNSGRYPLCARGDINSYAVFAEGMRSVLNERGRVGCVLPTGIATDDTTKFFFQDVVGTKSLVSLFDFENKGVFFPDVHRNYKFCLFTTGRGLRPSADRAEFVFFADSIAALRDPERRFALSPGDIALINPNTHTCPIFRSGKDAELTKANYRRVPVLIREARDGESAHNPWGIRFNRMFDMANDSHLFHTRERLEADGWQLAGNVFRKGGAEYLPLYEAKMIHQFDHRWASFRVEGDKTVSADVPLPEKQDPAFAVLPRYWVEAREIHRRIPVTSTTDSGRDHHPRRMAHLPGPQEPPASLRPNQTLCDGDAGGNANLPDAWPSGPEWTECARIQEAGGLHTQRTESPQTQDAGGSCTLDTGSLHCAGESLVNPIRSLALRLPADAVVSNARSSTRNEASKLAEDPADHSNPRWLMGWRDITRSVENGRR